MSDIQGGQVDSFIDLSLEKVDRIERALGHLAKAIELDLVDIALDPNIVSNGQREKFAMLGQRLAELSGITYELVADISSATGIPIETGGQPVVAVVHQPTAELERPPARPLPTNEATSPPADTTETPAPPTSPTEPASAGQTEALAGEDNKADSAEQDSRRIDLRIIDIEQTPEMKPVDETEAIALKITGNSTIEIAGQTIKLTKAELAVFNGLLLTRDKPRSGKDLNAVGDMPAVISTAIKTLSEKLNLAARKEIIKKIGDKRFTKYAFNFRVVLSDERTEEEKQSATHVKKN